MSKFALLKISTTLLGILFLVSGLVLFNSLRQQKLRALALDDEQKKFGMIGGEFLPCSWEAETPERVMSENKTQAILVTIKNELDETCQSLITLSAPGFQLSPQKDEQTITLNAQANGSLSWIVSPLKSGAFEVSVSDSLNTKVFGISVTNVFGLSALQAKIASMLGTIFGPMLTVPWWWDWLKKRKQKPVAV